jgi:hypothetical protein
MAQQTGLVWLKNRMDELGYKNLDSVAFEIGTNRGNLWRYFNHDNIPNMGLLPVMCNVLAATPTELLRALKILGPRQSL